MEAIRERARHRRTLMRGSKTEQAEGLRLTREEYAEDPGSGSSAMELGVTLMWHGQYVEAWEHFHSIIETDPRVGDGDYGMAGVAKWCLGEPEEAVSQWQAGLKAPYSRTPFGVYMGLLLFFASVVRPEVFDQNEARSLLREKLADPRSNKWPGTIAKLVLGQISEEELQRSCQSRTSKETDGYVWKTDFYRHVLAYDRMTPLAFADSMRKLTDTEQPQWQENDVFGWRIWCEEFFLARFEGAN